MTGNKPKAPPHRTLDVNPDAKGACCKCPLSYNTFEYVYCGLHRDRDVVDDNGAPKWCPLRKGGTVLVRGVTTPTEAEKA